MTTALDDGRLGRDVAVLPASEYNGGEMITLADASAAATIPTGTTTVFISARGGAVNFLVNGTAASATSPGYVPEDNQRFVFLVSNLDTLHVFGATGAFAHIEYYKD